jgi:hypothetical protein
VEPSLSEPTQTRCIAPHPVMEEGGAAGLTFGAARDATHAAFQSLHHWGGGEWNPASPNPPKPGASLTPSWRSAALRPSVDDGVQREVIDPRRMSESQCPTIARHAHTREVRSHIAMANLRIAGATENGP